MTGSYIPRPALKIESGYIVFDSVQKRFPAFLRCHARHYLAQADFSEAEVAASPIDFRNMVARLSPNPILGPLEGGVPLIMYLAGRGLEEDFKELVDEIQEEGRRLFDIPDVQQPMMVVYGNADALEDQQLNPTHHEEAAAAPVATPTEAPVAETATMPAPVVADAPAMTPPSAPVEAAPTPVVETAAPVAEVVEAAPIVEAKPVEATPVAAPVAAPMAETTPEAAPVTREPVKVVSGDIALPTTEIATQPEVAEATPVEATAAPVVAPPPAPVTTPAPVQPPTLAPSPAQAPAAAKPPTVLALGTDYFALHGSEISGTSVVVWQARRLAGPPADGEYNEVLQPTATTYERLVDEARRRVQYTDSQSGDLVAIKLALRGNEDDLTQAFELIRRVGPKAIKAYYPNPAVPGSSWSADFPAFAAEWVEGTSITESPAFSESIGLDLAGQLLELVQAARQSAPEILLTDGLKPSNIVITYDARGLAHPRIIDWNVFGAPDAEGVAAMLKRLGETLADLFADIRPETYTDLTTLGLGKPGDPHLGTWDLVSAGTRTLIRRVLRQEFEGEADSILAEIAQVLSEQRVRWNDNDPLWQSRLTDGYLEKLNWLDIAAVKLGNLTTEARARLDEGRVNETIDLVTNYATDGKYYEAVFELRVASRRFPQASFFRWALLANTVATLSPEGAYKRLRMDEALTLMSIDEFAAARNALDHGVAFFDEVEFDPAQRERARDYVSALAMCSQALALTESALTALNESWNVEDAESKLALATDRLERYERLAGDLLHGRDTLCLEKLATLRQAIDSFYSKHGRYDPYAARRETTEQARRANFNKVVERGWNLAKTDKPADWSAAMLLFDRAATEFPDLWKEDHDRERTNLGNKVGLQKLAEARQALSKNNWSSASGALAAAQLYPASHDEAARLQGALWTYQRGEIELQRNDLSAALSSFAIAAEASPELRPAAEAQEQKVRERGGTALGNAVGTELGKRFAEQQETLRTLVTDTAIAASEQGRTKQMETLKQLGTEQAAAQLAALQKFQAEQDERQQASLTKMQRELRDQQAAVIKKAEEDQALQFQKLMMQITDEQSESQKQALAKFQKEASGRLQEIQDNQPDWFTKSQQAARKAQDEQDAKLASTLKTVEDAVAWLRVSASKAETEADAKTAPAADESVKELSWKMEGTTSTLNRMQGRLNALVGLNVLLLLALFGTFACGGAYLLVPGLRQRITLPGVVTTAVAASGTTAPVATSAPVVGQATAPVVQVVTSLPPTQQAVPSNQTLSCANSDQPKSFYDCVVTNLTDQPLALALVIEPDQVNGFFYSVQIAGQPVQPDSSASDLKPGAAQFTLGNFGTRDSMNIRVGLACTSASGCKTTKFNFIVKSPDGGEVPDNQIEVTTSYTPK